MNTAERRGWHLSWFNGEMVGKVRLKIARKVWVAGVVLRKLTYVILTKMGGNYFCSEPAERLQSSKHGSRRGGIRRFGVYDVRQKSEKLVKRRRNQLSVFMEF